MSFLSRLFTWRYLFSSPLRFVPLLSWVTFAGIALGVFFLVVVLSIMRGFQEELSARWIGLNAHFTLTDPSKNEEHLLQIKNILSQIPEIEEVQNFVSGEAILQITRDGKTDAVAVKLRGVDFVSPSFLKKVALYPPKPPNWEKPDENGYFGLLAGSELLATIGIHPDFLAKVTLVYPYGEVGPTGDFLPAKKDFLISHAFETGLYAWDAYTVFVPFSEARKLLGKRGEEGLNIRLHRFSKLGVVQKKIQALAPAMNLLSFAEANKRLYLALKLERWGMTMLLFLFLVIASFSVVGLLLMFLSSKRRDFAILQALGLSKKKVQNIYLSLGISLGSFASLIGGLLGIFVCLILSFFPIRLPETYYLNYLPIRLEPFVVLSVFALACFLTLVSSWYPAFLAKKLEILPALREE